MPSNLPDKRSMPERTRGLLLNIVFYIVSFAIGIIPFILIDDPLLASAAFTAVATFILFCFSTVFEDVSIYDPYWSVAPFVIILSCMIKYGFWTVNAIILLVVIGLWSARLTLNWYYTYRGIRHEDWRYAQYREKCSPLLFHLISFFGLHFIPTIVVYGGLVSAILSLSQNSFAPLSVIGLAVMLLAVLLELVSDQSIHRFLLDHRDEHRTCDVFVWKYSRHPNYLGEMSFWTGLYLYFLALRPDIWYLGLGFLSIILLFLFVSIPMMEKHNAARREDYRAYQERTSMLLLLPPKK